MSAHGSPRLGTHAGPKAESRFRKQRAPQCPFLHRKKYSASYVLVVSHQDAQGPIHKEATPVPGLRARVKAPTKLPRPRTFEAMPVLAKGEVLVRADVNAYLCSEQTCPFEP